ncbi:hypothetical protein [Enterocloster bolteae]|jgi:hypothetical protein|uniref:hypothetical protein n=1 Tax=Enterocloster bolteae TaxID=208479 RepID=UPI000EC9C89B|nr:hypothetical protein [Enterocloster bolteae]RGO78090.1 hypothetical protein DXB04_27715 [Enterocloster bolteae]
MRRTKEQEKIDNIISDRNIRDKCVSHYEVLERVKELFLLPDTDLMSINQVAEYYEVSPQWIKDLYTQNKNEIDSDGTKMIKRNHYDGSLLKTTSVEKKQTSVTYIFDNGQIVTINNRGLKAFSRRAVLRIGMLLQQSDVARRVRDALLDIEEKASPEVKIKDIEEEQNLMMEVGRAVASGDANAVAIASTNLIAFKNRHIEKLENDNKRLAGEILEWSDRNRLNAGVRKLASVTGIHFSKIWNELYKNLQYKYRIYLKQRGGTPYIQWIDEDEWKNVLKVFCAMCEAYKQSPTEMFQQTTPKENLHNAS